MALDPSILLGMLQARGLSPFGAAALTSRAGAESSYDPAASGDNGTSYGLWQFHGPRKAGLMSFAQSAGRDPADPNTQADYLVHELGSTEKTAGGLLGSAQTREQAAAGAMAFERPAGWSAGNPAGGLGYGKTLAGISALLGNGGAPAAPVAAPVPAAPVQPSTEDPAPAPVQPQALPGLNLGDEQQQPQPLQGLLASLLPQRGVLNRGGLRPIASILGRRA